MRDDYQNAIINNFSVQDTQGVKINVEDPRERLGENYTSKDLDWHTGAHSGDVYISTPEDTHKMIANHHKHMNDVDYDGRYQLPEDRYPGTSCFFTNEDTAMRSFRDDGKFDSVQLGHDLQQAPYYDEDLAMKLELQGKEYFSEYNGNLDCFRVNEEKMLDNYGTTDFYAAQAKCLENTAWGEGGGHQGYNPYVNQMINNGSLEYVPEKSRTCDSNKCLDYADRKAQTNHEALVTNNHIENSEIQGGPNQRIGYNEISRSSNVESGEGKSTYLNQNEARKPTTTADVSPPATPKKEGEPSFVGPKMEDLPPISPPREQASRYGGCGSKDNEITPPDPAAGLKGEHHGCGPQSLNQINTNKYSLDAKANAKEPAESLAANAAKNAANPMTGGMT